MLLGGRGEDQNAGDVMGGGTSSVENDDDHHDDNCDNKTPVCNISKKTAPSMVAAFSKPVEQIHVPSTSTSKKIRNVWSNHIKDCMRKELGDCIGHENIKNLTPARASEFLKKYNIGDRGYSNFENVIYNMIRPPIKK